MSSNHREPCEPPQSADSVPARAAAADRDAFLEPFLIEPGDWCRRLDWGDVFGDRRRSIEVDVGAGKGRLLVERAQSDADAGFVGIERQLVRCRKIARKAAAARLDNVRLIRADARYVLEYLVPPATVRTLYVLFPDPWPKKRHRAHRLVRDDSPDMFHRCLAPGGTLHFATDHGPYFAEASKILAASPLFEPLDPDAPECFRPVTEFEAMYTAESRPLGRAVFRARPFC